MWHWPGMVVIPAVIISITVPQTACVDSTIYDLTEEESISIIEEIEKECAQNRSTEELSIYDRSQLCLSNFSSTVCWPTTPAGQNAVVPCPYYVSGVRMGGVAVRSCNVTTVLPKMDITNQTKVIWEFSPPDFTDCLSASQSDHVEILVTIGTAGYAISTLSLICAITIMVKFRRLHCPRNTIHINLFAAILFRCIVHFVQTIYTTGQVDWQIKWLCRTLSALTNFTVVATYSWVFIEALFLHNTVLMNVMNESIISVIFYITMGWILPLLITVIWVILRSTVTTGAICWIVDSSPNSPSRLLVVLFPVIVILLNIAFFINILRVIWGKLNSQSSNEASRLRTIVRSTSVLVLIFGIYHVIFVPLDLMDSNDSQQETAYLELIKLYYRQVLEALQGFCVALIFCFLNKEVTSEIKRFYKQSQLRSTVMDTTPQPRSKSRSWLLKGNLPISVIRRSKWNDFWKMTRWRRQRHTSFVRPSGPRKPSSLCQQTNSRRSDVKREIVIGTI